LPVINQGINNNWQLVFTNCQLLRNDRKNHEKMAMMLLPGLSSKAKHHLDILTPKVKALTGCY
jgi:hypothetical protein